MPQDTTVQTTRSGRVIIIMGPPNAGKDTQAILLADRLGGKYIGSGELIRREADPRLMAIMGKGGLVPAGDFRRLVGKAVAEVPLACTVVLAGVAKKPAEAHWLLEYLPSLDRWLDRVILVTLSKKVSLERSRQRDGARQDDHPEVQEERWDRYFQETTQSLEFFRQAGVLAEIDGSGTQEEVSALIDQILGT